MAFFLHEFREKKSLTDGKSPFLHGVYEKPHRDRPEWAMLLSKIPRAYRGKVIPRRGPHTLYGRGALGLVRRITISASIDPP